MWLSEGTSCSAQSLAHLTWQNGKLRPRNERAPVQGPSRAGPVPRPACHGWLTRRCALNTQFDFQKQKQLVTKGEATPAFEGEGGTSTGPAPPGRPALEVFCPKSENTGRPAITPVTPPHCGPASDQQRTGGAGEGWAGVGHLQEGRHRTPPPRAVHQRLAGSAQLGSKPGSSACRA